LAAAEGDKVVEDIAVIMVMVVVEEALLQGMIIILFR